MTMKNLMLAGVAGLCLALGACTQPPVAAPMVQSGSSDIESPQNPYNVSSHPQFDFQGADGGAGTQ
jgi:hypothetical protein